jgi:hypothetical protein
MSELVSIDAMTKTLGHSLSFIKRQILIISNQQATWSCEKKAGYRTGGGATAMAIPYYCKNSPVLVL